MLKTQGSLQQRSFFDSLIADALKANPLLSKVDSVLNELPALLDPFVAAYGKDRADRGVNNGFGRPTTPIESVVRLILVKHLHKNCAFRDVEERTKTDYAWKGFARLSLTDKVPDHTSLNNWELFFGEKAIGKLHNQIIDYCTEKRIVKGRKLRTDTTVAPAHIHYPTDAGLLADAVRVITRTVKKIKETMRIKTVFRSRMKKVKDKMREIGNSLKKRAGGAKEAVKTIIREILAITGKVVERGRLVRDELSRTGDILAFAAEKQLDHFLGLAGILIGQTVKALNKEHIRNRVVSVFQPSMRPIPKGKLWPPCEFGRKIQVDEVEHGIISDWKIFLTNRSDAKTVVPAVNRHKRRFGRDPALVAADRGCHAEGNTTALKSRVTRIAIPHRGYKTKRRLRTERARWFREAQDWRAGGEATISVLKRTSAVGKNRAKTEFGYLQGIGWGIIGRNLRTIAAMAG
jgi:transposase, IS5 family